MKIEVGKILKAQGVKGEIKLECYLDDSALLRGVKQLYIGSQTYTVEHIRLDGKFCYVALSGITDRNAAESLRNWSVFADKESISIPQNRFFVSDLIGCRVQLDDGKVVGDVTDVLQYGAADVFVCELNDKKVYFPFLNDLVAEINVKRKSIVLLSGRFGEVAVYED